MMQKKKKLLMPCLLHLVATGKDVKAVEQFVQKLGLKPGEPSELIETRKRGYSWFI